MNKGDVLYNNFKKDLNSLSIKSRLFSPGMTLDTKPISPISTKFGDIEPLRHHAVTAKYTKRKLPKIKSPKLVHMATKTFDTEGSVVSTRYDIPEFPSTMTNKVRHKSPIVKTASTEKRGDMSFEDAKLMLNKNATAASKDESSSRNSQNYISKYTTGMNNDLE